MVICVKFFFFFFLVCFVLQNHTRSSSTWLKTTNNSTYLCHRRQEVLFIVRTLVICARNERAGHMSPLLNLMNNILTNITSSWSEFTMFMRCAIATSKCKQFVRDQ